MQYVALACRFAVLVVFFVAVTSKVRSRTAFRSFRDATRRLLPFIGQAATGTAVGVCVIELTVVALLIVPVGVPVGYALAVVSLAGFSVAITMALLRGVRAPCRCFGATETPMSVVELFRNGTLGVLAIIGLLFHEVGSSAWAHPAGTALSCVAAGVLALGLIFIDDFVALFTTIG